MTSDTPAAQHQAADRGTWFSLVWGPLLTVRIPAPCPWPLVRNPCDWAGAGGIRPDAKEPVTYVTPFQHTRVCQEPAARHQSPALPHQRPAYLPDGRRTYVRLGIPNTRHQHPPQPAPDSPRRRSPLLYTVAQRFFLKKGKPESGPQGSPTPESGPLFCGMSSRKCHLNPAGWFSAPASRICRHLLPTLVLLSAGDPRGVWSVG